MALLTTAVALASVALLIAIASHMASAVTVEAFHHIRVIALSAAPAGVLNSDALPSDLHTIHLIYSIISISSMAHGHKSKARGIMGDPHIIHAAEAFELFLEVILLDVGRRQVSDEYSVTILSSS